MELEKLSRKELEKIIRQAQQALKNIDKKERQLAKKAAEEAAAKFGFKLSELIGSTSARKSATPKDGAKSAGTAAAKYANPDDPAQTWTGKGRQPKWFKDAIAAGKTPESLEV